MQLGWEIESVANPTEPTLNVEMTLNGLIIFISFVAAALAKSVLGFCCRFSILRSVVCVLL